MPARLDENSPIFTDLGNPAVGGNIYIGTKNLDPKTNLITIYADEDLTVELANPQTLGSNGRPENKIYIPGQYSVQVDDSNDAQLYQDLTAGEETDTGITSVSNIQGTNAITGETSPAITSYTDKETYIFETVAANTGAITLDFGGGVKDAVVNNDDPIQPGQFQANQTVEVVYNATADNFKWTNQNLKVLYMNEASSIASGGTIDLSTARGNVVPISGSGGPVTSFGTVKAGAEYILIFQAGGSVITYNGTSLIIPGSQDITMEQDDHLRVRSLGSGNWEVMSWGKLSGFPVISIDRDLSTVSVDNTATETSIYSYSVPAGMLGVDRLIHVQIAGTYRNGGSGTRTLTINLKYGTTTVATFGRSNVAIDPVSGFMLDVYLCGDESSTAQKGWFVYQMVDESGDVEPHNVAYGTATETSTGALTLDVTVQHSAAAADLNLTKEAAFAKLS